MKRGLYAGETDVSPEKSLMEIQSMLKRYGASKFGYIEDEARTIIGFEYRTRRVRFIMTLPLLKDHQKDVTGRVMPSAKQRQALEKTLRQKWRALVMNIQAKFESVLVGIESFDEAFMAQLVLPDGQTMGEWAAPQIAAMYQNGQMPPLLPEPKN